jgi:hypothetical protein
MGRAVPWAPSPGNRHRSWGARVLSAHQQARRTTGRMIAISYIASFIQRLFTPR